MPNLVARASLASCLISIASLLSTGCQQTPASVRQYSRVEIVTARETEEPSSPHQHSNPLTSEPVPAIDYSELPLIEQAESWASRLLLVEARGSGVTISGEGDVVEVSVPCRLRLDESVVTAWAAQFTDAVELEGSSAGQRRLLTRAATHASPFGSSPSSDCGGPAMSMGTLDLAVSDDPATFGLIIADRPGWGAAVKVFRLDRDVHLSDLLRTLVKPRTVELLAYADGEVVHGSSLPLLPTAYNGPRHPQPMASPWWVRDRRESQTQDPIWRHAQSWLTPDRTLAAAMAEVPDTVGDVLFLPMLGWKAGTLASAWAVGSFDMTIRLSLPRETAVRIDRFEFRVAD